MVGALLAYLHRATEQRLLTRQNRSATDRINVFALSKYQIKLFSQQFRTQIDRNLKWISWRPFLIWKQSKTFLQRMEKLFADEVMNAAAVVMMDKPMADDMIAANGRPLPRVKSAAPTTVFKAQARGYRP